MLPLRLLCSPVKAKFFVAPMNLIDFLSLLPFYISLIFIALEDFSDIGKAGKIIRLIKVQTRRQICKIIILQLQLRRKLYFLVEYFG